jgi:hypothetical protein
MNDIAQKITKVVPNIVLLFTVLNNSKQETIQKDKLQQLRR